MEKENVVRLCKRLIKTPSLSCREGRVAEVVADEMNSAGFDEVRIDPLGSVLGIIRGRQRDEILNT